MRFNDQKKKIRIAERYGNEYHIKRNQVESAQYAVKLAWVRYDNGLTNYLEILDLQRSEFNSKLAALTRHRLYKKSLIN